MASTKKQALEMIKKLPEKATWDDIMYKIYVREKIAEGLKAADEGRVTPLGKGYEQEGTEQVP